MFQDNNTVNNTSNNKCNYQEIINLFNEKCISFPKVLKISDSRKEAIRARLKSKYNLEDFSKLFDFAEASDFLKGNNDKNWSANFDWLIKDTNIVKVLEGKYANRNNKPSLNKSKFNNFEQKSN